MLVTAGLILACVSAYIEIELVRSSPILKKFLMRHKLFPMLMSLALSIVLGMAFSAVGLTVMIAGMGSTLLTRPYYLWLEHGDRARASVKAQKLRLYTGARNAVPKPIFVTTSYIYHTIRKK